MDLPTKAEINVIVDVLQDAGHERAAYVLGLEHERREAAEKDCMLARLDRDGLRAEVFAFALKVASQS